MTQSLASFRQFLVKVISVLGSLCLAFMLAVTVADVVLRSLNPNWRIFGVLDYVELSLDWLLFLAIPVAILQQRVISVDLIDGADRKRIFKLIGMLLTLAIFSLLASQVIRPALDTLEWQERTLDLAILKFHYWVPVWIGTALCCIAAFLNILNWFWKDV
ncbi:TRAP transporter small permease [Leisingera sp. ANG-Vp]|uniref:TRAP transporter small permease n=1 Tax=Leisingera sp. ANG-Vp TaxID=1577896 RepID=UPI00057FB2C6|nr:TRAP transporter small permease subunit [Leisingera sp. ANG-Vp]KIC21495.1 hypothetical protein RA20_03885 [Leisingera sp. ANG-Vp]